MLAGELIPAGTGLATIQPDFDFETYSEAGYRWDVEGERWQSLEGIRNTERGLKVVGVYNYVQHPTFEVLSLAYNLKDGKGARLWRPGLAYPEDLFEHICHGGLLEAWNVGFEWAVWQEWCVPLLGWPPLIAENMRDAMAKSRAWSMPGQLEAAARDALKLVNGKDEAGKALIRKLTVPHNPTKKNPSGRWTPANAPEDFQRFYAYNVQDIIAEAEVSTRIPDLCPREFEIWQVDQAINRRGMQIDRKAVDDCIAIVELAGERYNAQLREITRGHVQNYSEVAKTLEWLRLCGIHMPNFDEDAVADQLKQWSKDVTEGRIHEAEIAPFYQVLRIRQVLGFGSVKKLYTMRVQTCADGRLREQYAYHSQLTAHTGSHGVQVANLYKGKLHKPEEVERALGAIATGSLDYVEGVFGDALETVADCLRSMIVAKPGHRLIASDYTAIQAVVTAALAGEEWRLEVFRTHGKIYEMCAASITGKTLQFYLDYKKQTGHHHEDRNPFGKIPELSSGFGGWIGAWKKFGAGEFMNDDQIKDAILKWRAASPAIVELWGGQTRNRFRWNETPELYGLEGAAIAAVLTPGECFGYRGIRYQMHGDVLYCQPLGDGAPLVYHEPRLRPAAREWARPWELDLSCMAWSSQGGWQREALYGGVLTQNVVAKQSREIQANATVALERAGYPVVMHTYDEVVTEMPHGVGSAAGQLEIVNRLPWWAVDGAGRPWPIKAPGAEETQRYGKWE